MLTKLLEGIRKVAVGADFQRLFAGSGAFEKVLTCLVVPINVSTEKREEIQLSLRALCNDVLRTLIALMAGNSRSKERFQKTIGYDQLYRVLLHATENKPDRSTIDLLLDMVSDVVSLMVS